MMMMTHCQDHILTENIWFVWSKTSYSAEEGKIDRATQPLDCWKAEFRKMLNFEEEKNFETP